MNEPKRSAKAQEDANEGLFDTGARKQGTMFNKQGGGNEVPLNAVRVAPGISIIPKESFTAHEKELVEKVNQEIDRIYGKGAVLHMVDRLYSNGEHGEPGTVSGATTYNRTRAQQFIYAAMSAEDGGKEDVFDPARMSGPAEPFVSVSW